LEVAPHLAEEPAQEQTIDDAERMVGDDHQGSARRNARQRAGLEIEADAEERHGVVPQRCGAAVEAAVGAVLTLQGTLTRHDLDGAGGGGLRRPQGPWRNWAWIVRRQR